MLEDSLKHLLGRHLSAITDVLTSLFDMRQFASLIIEAIGLQPVQQIKELRLGTASCGWLSVFHDDQVVIVSLSFSKSHNARVWLGKHTISD